MAKITVPVSSSTTGWSTSAAVGCGMRNGLYDSVSRRCPDSMATGARRTSRPGKAKI